MSSREQLKALKKAVWEANPTGIIEVRNAVEQYFAAEGWSILKAEWEKMSPVDRVAFAQKLLKEMRAS